MNQSVDECIMRDEEEEPKNHQSMENISLSDSICEKVRLIRMPK